MYIPAVNCSDYFAEEVNQDEESKAYFDDAWRGPFGKVEQFVCPDTSQLDLLNWNYIFYAEIYACDAAVKFIDSPAAYGDVGCEPYDETSKEVDAG